MTCSIWHATDHNKRYHAKEKSASSAIDGQAGEITGGNNEAEVQGNTPANVGSKRHKYITLRMSDSQSHQRTANLLDSQAS
ncbi:hypothetical protein J5N97_026046 [Dioscorea zingiberensis]|uniref:Uncharacterized protein n=1 Tax=Dioscorea zingiberensis TaxID=325984 RepID=A0A9D5H6A4_9LILI|nr:hypothetical protein J5N97_026046 [Dioscorea zingiberensis]